jgi:uncharacterized integral membrane protein (TIGR00698 family)
MSRLKTLPVLLPGLGLASVIALLAAGLGLLQIHALGTTGLDALVLAIVLGMLARAVFGLPEAAQPGIRFASKTVLEAAIVLLGASIGAAEIVGLGGSTMLAVMLVVLASLGLSYALARGLGLDERLAILIACGNSICGSSAILASAPVVGATERQIASAIAFTSALGALLVLILPMAATLLDIGDRRYGIIAGMSVYAVPQVLAATAAISAQSAQVGTLVKLMRVLMLAPILVVIGLIRGRAGKVDIPFGQIVPWFILGFLLLMGLRFFGLFPPALLEPTWQVSRLLTLVAMAALGLSVDIGDLLAGGGRVLTAGIGSLILLVSLASLASTVLA